MTKVTISVSSEDVEAAADQGDFVQAPVGMYCAELVGLKPGHAKGDDGKPDKSRPYLECIWKITGVGREGAALPERYSQIWDYVSFGESSKWKMAQFALTLGLPMDAKGNIKGEIETEENKPGTVVGTKAFLKVKKDVDQAGDYKAKVGGTYPIDGSAAESGADAFADDGPADDVFGEDAGEVEGDLWTQETLEAVEDLKALGAEATAFDLTPQEYIVKVKGKVDQAATKAALIEAILEAQNGTEGDTEDADGEEPDPF